MTRQQYKRELRDYWTMLNEVEFALECENIQEYPQIPEHVELGIIEQIQETEDS